MVDFPKIRAICHKKQMAIILDLERDEVDEFFREISRIRNFYDSDDEDEFEFDLDDYSDLPPLIDVPIGEPESITVVVMDFSAVSHAQHTEEMRPLWMCTESLLLQLTSTDILRQERAMFHQGAGKLQLIIQTLDTFLPAIAYEFDCLFNTFVISEFNFVPNDLSVHTFELESERLSLKYFLSVSKYNNIQSAYGVYKLKITEGNTWRTFVAEELSVRLFTVLVGQLNVFNHFSDTFNGIDALQLAMDAHIVPQLRRAALADHNERLAIMNINP